MSATPYAIFLRIESRSLNLHTVAGIWTARQDRRSRYAKVLASHNSSACGLLLHTAVEDTKYSNYAGPNAGDHAV